MDDPALAEEVGDKQLSVRMFGAFGPSYSIRLAFACCSQPL
jgi:hypothetical protein